MSKLDTTDDDLDLYDQLIERKRYKIVQYIKAQVFFDRLRQNNVLTEDDEEEIKNSNVTRRRQAGHFLDILQTKGNNGVEQFLEILEYEYPHVYREVTSKEPRKPPADYQKHRESYYAHWLYKLPELAEDLKKDYEQHRDLKQKIQDMQDVMKFVQDNNTELEKENHDLREKLKLVTKDKDILENELANCLHDRGLHRDKCMEYLENNNQLLQEINNLKDSLRDLRHERDDMEKQNATLSDRIALESRRRSSTPAHSVPLTPPPRSDAISRKDSAQDIQIKILQEQLEQEQEKCEELSTELSRVQEELDSYQSKLRKNKLQIERLDKEVETKNTWLSENKKRVEKYFNQIQALQEEKKKIDEERIKEQEKVKKEQEKSEELFRRIHKLENELEEMRSENEKLKVQNNRFSSGSSFTDDPSPCVPNQLIMHDDKMSPIYPDIHEDDPYTGRNEYVENLSGYHGAQSGKSSTLPLTLAPTRTKAYESCSRQYSEKVRPQNIKNTTDVTLSDLNKKTHQPTRNDSMAQNVPGSLRNRQVDEDHYEPRSMPFRSIPLTERGADKLEDSQDSQNGSLLTPCRFESYSSLTSDGSEEVDTELMGFNVHVEILPLRPKLLPKKMGQQGDITKTYKLSLPVLDEKVKITGGNFTGIFISEIPKKLENNITVGDQVMSVQLLNSKDYTCLSKEEMRHLTLDEARIAFMLETRADDKQELEITLQKTIVEDYESIKKWMTNNNSSGDYFYVCSKASFKDEPDCLSVRKGDVLRVTNSCIVKGDRKFWKVSLYDKVKNKWATEGIIPAEFRKLKGATSTVERRYAFRFRSQLYRVLPMKAIAKLPVVLHGASDVVMATQHLIIDDSSDYLMYNAEKGRDRPVDILRHCLSKGKHCLMKDVMLVKAPYTYIVIAIDTKNSSPDILRNIFGQSIDGDFSYQELQDDITHGVISISKDGITERRKFLEAVYDKVAQGQKRVYWLSSSHLDGNTVRQYSAYFGKESSEKSSKSQAEGSLPDVHFLRSASTPM